MRARLNLSVAGAVAATAAAAFAQDQSSTAPVTLDSGQWELRSNSEPVERICIRDARQFIQLRHQGQLCESFVVTEASQNLTVQYTCRGKGYGRTHVRAITDRFVQIDTQGIAKGLPFNFVAEARWIGARCTG